MTTTFLCLIFAAAAVPSDVQVEERHASCASLPQRTRAPDYWIQDRAYSAEKPPTLVLQVNVAPEAATGDEATMVRLSCKLASDFPDENRIYALVLDDKKATQRLLLRYTDQRNHGTYLWHVRAHYELHRDKKEQFIEYLVPELKDKLLTLKWVKIWISLAE